jgi:hypothetical protein
MSTALALALEIVRQCGEFHVLRMKVRCKLRTARIQHNSIFGRCLYEAQIQEAMQEVRDLRRESRLAREVIGNQVDRLLIGIESRPAAEAVQYMVAELLNLYKQLRKAS